MILTWRAIGHLFEMAHEINAYLVWQIGRMWPIKPCQTSSALYLELGDLLGIFMEKSADDQEEMVDKVLGVVARLRQTARHNKNYELADTLRDFLRSEGVTVEDLEGGSRFRYETLPELDHLVSYLLSVRSSLKASRNYELADQIRDQLTQAGIVVEDTREGVRWKLAES